MDRNKLLETASRAAGDCLADYFGKDLTVRKKGRLDLVTEADEAAERLFVEAVTASFPDDAILAEESGRREGSSLWQWIVDPLDGTTNFAHGFPQFCVSAALAYAGELRAGIIYDPIKRELFRACLGEGATLNGEPIQVAARDDLEEALAVTGFSYDRRTRMAALLDRVARLLANCQGMRRLGSAALDLAYVACGRFDLFLEDGLNPWDIAAGTLIVREAGGVAVDFTGTGLELGKGQVLATNSALLRDALARLLPDR